MASSLNCEIERDLVHVDAKLYLASLDEKAEAEAEAKIAVVWETEKRRGSRTMRAAKTTALVFRPPDWLAVTSSLACKARSSLATATSSSSPSSLAQGRRRGNLRKTADRAVATATAATAVGTATATNGKPAAAVETAAMVASGVDDAEKQKKVLQRARSEKPGGRSARRDSGGLSPPPPIPPSN